MANTPRPLAAAGILLGLALAGLASAQQPQAPPGPDYSAYPCLSYTLSCGKVPTRKPVKKTLGEPLNGDAERGKQAAFARNRGNCLACHAMRGGDQMGTRGLDLRQFGTTARSDAEAFAMVYDMRTLNPETLMPPFGTNEVLSEQDIRDIVAFLQSSK